MVVINNTTQADRLSVPLHHSPQQGVNLIFATSEITSVDEVIVLLAPAAIWSVQLEVPEEIGGLLEMRSDRVDLVD